jgi:hypothetical protein
MTDLYRFYDHEGALLYVGISKAAINRWSQHGGDKAWWDDVETTTVEHFETRELADAAETRAIQSEGPRYNIAKRWTRRPAQAVIRLLARSAGWGRGPLPFGVYRMPDDGSGRCCSVRRKPHIRTRTNAQRTAQGSSWRCVLDAGHEGPHQPRKSAHQPAWADPEEEAAS